VALRRAEILTESLTADSRHAADFSRRCAAAVCANSLSSVV